MKIFIFLILFSSSSLAQESLSVALFGITAHGERPRGMKDGDMKRKIDSAEVFAHHVEFNMTYKKEKIVYTSLIIKDCFDNTAYYLGMGRVLWADQTSDVSFVLGLYVRPSVHKVEVPDQFQKGGYDYLPLPWINYAKRFEIKENLNFETAVSTNLWLTHMNFGFNFQF